MDWGESHMHALQDGNPVSYTLGKLSIFRVTFEVLKVGFEVQYHVPLKLIRTQNQSKA